MTIYEYIKFLIERYTINNRLTFRKDLENIIESLLPDVAPILSSEIFPSPGGVVEDRGGPTTEDHPTPIRHTKNYMALPYNPALKERARALRKARNLSEVLFWKRVNKKQFKGLDFDRQKIIGNYIVDFYCASHNVVIEIDGCSHGGKEEYDTKRDRYLESLGLTVIHIPVKTIFNQLDAVMRELEEHEVFLPPGPRSTMMEEEEPPRPAGTPPKEEEPPRPTGTPPREEESPRPMGTPPREEEPPRPMGTPPREGRTTPPYGHPSKGGE